MKKHAKKIVTALLVVAMLVPTVAMLYTNAANSYTVELAFNNLFVFEEWANNKLSTTMQVTTNGVVSTEGAKLETDIENGTFTFTKTNMDATEAFTAFSANAEDPDGNKNYYTVNVEPNTTYAFSYNVEGSTWSFTPYVFMYTDEGLFAGFDKMVAYPTPAYGVNTFNFTTPANVDKIQVRFTLGDNSTNRTDNPTSVYAEVKDIMIYKVETIVGETNLFDFSTWSTKTGSGGGTSVYAAGSHTTDSEAGSVTITSSGTNNLGSDVAPCSSYLTNFSLGAYDDNAYVIDTEPGKTYTLTYNLDDYTVASSTNMMALIPWYNSEKTWISSYSQNESTSGANSFTFTVPDDVYHFQIVFGLYNYSTTNGLYATVSDIELRETTTLEHKVTPHRQVFTYDHSEADSNFYGELPEATAPDGYVFGGWYTGLNGTGERITPETKIHYSSMTVYANFELAVDSLEIATPATKTTYTVGEKLDTTGLSLKATINNEDGTTTTFNINSDIYCTPVYLNETGTQTITAHYGGKTVTFTVDVRENEESSIVFNGVEKTVFVANKNYAINEEVSAFNRYEIAYSTNSYVKGVMTFNGGASEVFFLEPSDNGTFASYVDNFVYGNTYNEVVSVKFTCLDNELGTFQLKSIKTSDTGSHDATTYFINDEYKLGVSLEYGGVVSELYDVDDDVRSRVYETTYDGTAKTISQVDYANKLDENYGDGYTEESTSVNLINTLDRGRYLQQSYYGTFEKPYVASEYNRSTWNYNPVQGGNVAEEASKVVDYEITDTYVYVKARPLDWAKWSDDHAESGTCNHLGTDGKPLHTEALWGDGYITDTYVEAWYYFEDGLIKVTNRKVDYSGLPENYTTQEMPALYVIEPLNHFVYNDVTTDEAWAASYDELTFVNEEEPEFWGMAADYSKYHYGEEPTIDKDNNGLYDAYIVSNENWAAFTASEDTDSFGVGIYSPGVSNLFYGVYPQKFAETTDEAGNYVQTDILHYRHAETVDPAPEAPTSYIAPVNSMTFKSYDPTEYTYYLSTGTEEEIYNNFRSVDGKVAEAELANTKIAVPETVYMNPSDNLNGQYYVNNIMDESNYYSVETEAESEETNMYFGIHVNDAVSFTVDVTNVTDSSNDIILGNADGTGNREGEVLNFDADKDDTFISDGGFSLRLSSALEHNETATAKWTITVTLANGTTEVYTAYTVLYAPERTVGAIAEAKQSNTINNEISSWITGANGVDHSQRAPLGSYKGDYSSSGYFELDPLAYPDTLPTGGSYENSNDYIVVGEHYDGNSYVLNTATQGDDHTRAQSYLGLLTVDSSRYTNTDQIPNLKIGYDVLRVGSAEKNSLGKYTTYYTLGTVNSYTGGSDYSVAPSGWTTNSGTYPDFASDHEIPYRETVVPSYSVSEIDGKYIHAINHGKCDYSLNTIRYSMAGTSVLCSVTDKSGLRKAVLEAYAQADESQDAALLESLEKAATVLGTPSATQEEIDNARTEINDILDVEVYSLKYDNLFSAYEFSLKTECMSMVQAEETKAADNKAVFDDKATVKYNDRTIIINSNNTDAEQNNVYTNFGPVDNLYNIPITGGTEYVFEYDVTTTGGAQAHVFFYDANGNEAVIDTSTASITGTNTTLDYDYNFAGGYTNGAGSAHVVIKFTAPSNAVELAFRFGNILADSNKSTFTNIRFCEARNYSEEVVYSETKDIYTEDLYNENTAYGELISPYRIGFDFLGWLYDFDDEETDVLTTDLATAHTSIFSNWYEHRYKLNYIANDGTDASTLSDEIRYTQTTTINDGTGFTRTNYILAGWATKADATVPDYALGQSVSRITPAEGAVIDLYAVWVLDTVNVTFDNLIDFNAWDKTAALNGKISDVTDTGFTLTSNAGADEATSASRFFTVEPGKQYKIEADITGDNWDVYIFFCDENGNWVDFVDGPDVKYSSPAFEGMSEDHIFTAPSNDSVVKAMIRVDANVANNSVKFDNIRVYEYSRGEINVTPVNKQVLYGDAFGTLPTPTREGYTFAGWYHGTTLVTSATTASTRDTYYLTSKWVANDEVLTEDIAVIDFDRPIKITPFSNDTVLAEIADATDAVLKLVGISADGETAYSTSLDGEYGSFSVSENNVTYTPSEIVNDVETVHYQASITSGGVTTTVDDTITVAPASNVLYEEDKLAVSNTTGLEWTTDGKAADTEQSASTVDDIYGYDASYISSANNYSNGSALKVNVDSNNKRSQILSFTFTGTGFNLYGACGADTGIQLVTIKNNDTGSMVKSYVVDTYYGDSTYGTLYQVPVVNENSLDYGNYTVQIMGSYLTFAGALNNEVSTQSVEGVDGMTANSASATGSQALADALAEIGMDYILDSEVEVVWFDDDSIFNGGKGANTTADGMLETAAVTSLLNVVDSIRVYNPLDDGDLYYIESETSVQYYNVMDNLVNGGAIENADEGLFAYVSGNPNAEITIDTYDEQGTKDEVYLASSTEKAITFTVSELSNEAKVMISLRAAYGSPKVKIGGVDMPITSGTEMYYNITNYVKDGTVTIQNVGEENSLLAIGYVKVTGPALATMSTFNLMTAREMMLAPSTEVDLNAPASTDTDASTPEDGADTGTDASTPEDGTDAGNDGSADENTEESFVVKFIKWLISLIKEFISTVKVIFSF